MRRSHTQDLENAARNPADSWPVVVAAAIALILLSWGGVGVAKAEGADKRSVASIASADGQQCQAGAVGEATRRAEYALTMERVKRRLEERGADTQVVTLNARGHNYGPAPSPTMPLDRRPLPAPSE